MAFGCCVRVILLSLLGFSKHAGALTYRSSSSSGVKPYFGMAEGFPHPSSRYESSVQPGSSGGIYGASYGRYINGYLQQGGASSYRPGSMSSSRPTQPRKQSHYQVKSDGVFQSKDAMWDFALPQKGNRLEAGIVSSYAIDMRSEPHQPRNDAKPQPHPERQQPLYRDSKPGPQPVPLAQQQQQRRYEDRKPWVQPFPLPQQLQSYEASKGPSAGVLQTKTGMWGLASNSNAGLPNLTPGFHYRQPQQLVPFYSGY